MAERGEMLDGASKAGTGVDEETRQTRHVAVDQHQGPPARVLEHPLLRQARGGEDEAFDLRGELAEQNILELGRLIGVAEKSGVAFVACSRLSAAHKRRKERVGDVR